MIKAIIFDMGGVILDLNAKKTLRMPDAISVMYDISLDSANDVWNGYARERLLTGRESPLQFVERVKSIVGTKKDSRDLLSKWTELSHKDVHCVNWKLLNFIEELRKKFKVYVMTDAVDIAQDDEVSNEIRSKFDGYFASYEEGFTKPNAEAFTNVLEKIGLSPDDCVFVDDTEPNTVAATKLGMKSLVYKSLDKLKKDFVAVNIRG